MKTVLFLLLLFVLSIITSAQAMSDDQYNQANAIYLEAVNSDDEERVQQAIKYFDQLQLNKPFDSLIKSFRGSLESIMATHVYMPWNKMKHVELGSEQMDEALDELTDRKSVV